jgi:hypothetical protein
MVNPVVSRLGRFGVPTRNLVVQEDSIQAGRTLSLFDVTVGTPEPTVLEYFPTA